MTPEQIKFIEKLRNKNKTWLEIAHAFNKSFSTFLTANAVRKAMKRYTVKAENPPKILFLDIETSPIEAYVWGLWENNVALNQIKNDWFIMAWAARFKGEKTMHYADQSKARDMANEKAMLQKIWKLLDEATVICGHNLAAFDIKKLNARFLKYGMQPPSPCQQIDTLKLAKKFFKLTSNKLEYLAKFLDVKHRKLTKRKFSGFDLWTECLARNKEAWLEMSKYNQLDVIVLEEVFDKLIQWDKKACEKYGLLKK